MLRQELVGRRGKRKCKSEYERRKIKKLENHIKMQKRY